MAATAKPGGGSAIFRRLGKVVHSRKKLVITAWVIALVLVVPVISQEGKVTSLQLGSTTGQQLESVKASNLISAEFPKSVPNSTLLIVVTSKNVSALATQSFVDRLVNQLKTDKDISGLNQTVDVYSRLYAAVDGVNKAVLSAYDGANGTSSLLLGVPRVYLGFWNATYASTRNESVADSVAFNRTAAYLTSQNATRYLSLFNSTWTSVWTNPEYANLGVLSQEALAARTAGEEYLATYSPGSEAFGTALLDNITLPQYAADSTAQATQRFSAFAVGYISNTTGYSTAFVASAFSLGRSYGNATLYSLVGDIVWNPGAYHLDSSLTTLVSSLVSPSRNTTLISLGLTESSDSNVVAVRAAVSSALASTTGNAGVRSALVTGEDAISYDFGGSAQADLALILPVTIILLLAATGLFFRSVLTPFITLGTIGLALGISQIFIVVVGLFVAKVDFTVPTILLTILIGVGTDYSVFVLARYREERVRGATVQEAVGTSVTWAGESITTSGATVIVSFLALAAIPVVYLKTIGYVVGLGVLVALLVALTLVPAVVSVVGGRTFWPNSGARFARYASSQIAKIQGKRGYFSRSGAFSVKRAKVLIVLALFATAPALYVYASTTPNFNFISAAPGSLQSIQASNLLTSSFGGGRVFPSYVVMTFDQPVVVGTSFDPQEMSTIQTAMAMIAASPGVRNVTGPAMPFGKPVDLGSINYSTSAGKRTFNAVMQGVGKDNKTILVTITYGIDPYSTAAIADAQHLRQALHASFDSASDVTGVFMGGASGSIIDTKSTFDNEFNSIVPLVAVGVALVLLVVLGSLFLPIFAVFSVLMSIVWTLAATKLVFQQLFNYQLLFIIPLFLFVALLGLGMDYNVFILTRIREEATKGKHLDDAIVGAIEQTGGIITAAAVILAGSLGALMLSTDLLLKEVGFAFAYSILIDALVVRTYLVPAVMSVMGRWNWWSPIPFLDRSKSLFEREDPPRTA